MKNKLLYGLILFAGGILFAQDSKISVELNYPFPVGDNFVGDSYFGIIDLGIDYKFTQSNLIAIGISVNGGLLKNNSSSLVEVTSYFIQPRVFGELNLEALKKIHPAIGIGYTFIIFDPSETELNTGLGTSNTTESGFNLNFGITYDITPRFFTQIQYDYIKLNPDDVPDISFNNNVNLLKIGLGYRL